MKEIYIALISAGIPAIVTLITSSKQKQLSKMHSARQSILQLIIEDHIRVSEHKLPENYKAICTEWDEYQANKGNSYMNKKVNDYFEWYDEVIDKINK